MNREMTRSWKMLPVVVMVVACASLLIASGALAAPSITEGPWAGSMHTGVDWGQEEYGVNLWVRVSDPGGLGNIQSVQVAGPDSSMYKLFDDGFHCDDDPGDGAYGWCDCQNSTPPGLGLYTFIATDKQGGTAIGSDTVERILDFPRNPSPSGTCVTAPTPLLSWGLVPDAVRYNLEVRDQDWNQAWERHNMLGTSVLYNDDATALPLVDGGIYQWGVGASDDQGNNSWHHTSIVFAYASNPGTISGQVQTTDSQPVAGVCVTAQTTPCGGWGMLGGVTDADGNYTISVPAGDYYVSTNVSCHGPRYYIDEWWNGSGGTTDCNQALPVSVSAGQNVPGIDFSLVQGGIIAGRITTDTGQPIANVCVNVTDVQCGGPNWYWGQSNQEGDYTVVVPQGTFFVQAYAACSGQNYALEWWDPANGTPDCNAAAAVNVTSGQTSGGIDFSLVEGATISGTVYESNGMTPIDHMDVIAVSGDPCGSQQHLGWAQTDAIGNYTLTGLAAGSYFLTTSNNGQSNFLNEWWTPSGSSIDCNAAQSLAVNPGDNLTGRDFQLDLGGSVSGRIASDTGQPLPNTCVNLYDSKCGGNHMGHARTDANGDYVVTGLPSGSYYASTHASCTVPELYIDEWWDGVNGATDCNQAAPIQVIAGQDTPGVNFSLTEGGSLSGRVTDDQGNGIGNVPVSVFYNRCWNGWAGGAQTDPDGYYTIWGLPVGDYFVIAQPKCTLPVNYENQWWKGTNGTSDCDRAAPVAVVAGSPTGEIDFSLKQGAPYPPPSFESVDMFSLCRPDGNMTTVFYAFIDGPSPLDVCSFTVTGPSGEFPMDRPSVSFRQFGLIYVRDLDFLVADGVYEFRLTDSMGRSVSTTRHFEYNPTVPQIDPGSMNPPWGSYLGTTTPTLSANVPMATGDGVVPENLRYQVMIQDYHWNAVWYASDYQVTPTFVIPEGVLQPDTPYWWFIRVIDAGSENRNRTQSEAMSFYTGTKGAPEINASGVITLPNQDNLINFFYGRVIHAAPWDVVFFDVTGPDLAVYNLLQGTMYGFLFPMINTNITFLDPPTLSVPDGDYTFRIEDNEGNIRSVVAPYAYKPVPDFLTDEIFPAANAYIGATEQPTFSWPRVAGDTGDGSYRYSIRITDYHERIRWYDSPGSPDTAFTLPDTVSLPKGSSYKWRVNVYGPGVAPGTDTNNYRSTLFRAFTLNPFRDPKPDIKINGQDGPVFVNLGLASNAAISLDPGDLPGEVCDWWIGVLTPFGNYWFTYPSLAWVPSGAPICVGQIGLMDLSPYSLLSYNLPTGMYTFFFILDNKPNGVLDDLTWYDYVNVFSSPEGLDKTAFVSEALSEEVFVDKIRLLMN
jgi:hypothetical protein